MSYIKVKGHEGLFRDPNTNSIINKNMAEYQEYVSRKKLKSEEDGRMKNLESEVFEIKNDLDEIKSMLRRFINESKWYRVGKFDKKFWICKGMFRNRFYRGHRISKTDFKVIYKTVYEATGSFNSDGYIWYAINIFKNKTRYGATYY